MTFSVAMNSARGHALVALLIASNFVEIKGAPVRAVAGKVRVAHALAIGVYEPTSCVSSHEAGCS